MPKCTGCGENFPNKKDLALVRDTDGKWVVLCKACQSALPDDSDSEAATSAPEAPTPDNAPASSENAFQLAEESGAAVEGDSTKAPETPAKAKKESGSARKQKSVLPPEDRIFWESLEKLEDLEKELAREAEERIPRTYKRAHTRFPAVLRLQFSHIRDDMEYPGIVRDISQGGLRFITRRALEDGQILFLRVMPKDADPSTVGKKSTAQVRRVREMDNGAFDVGVRFVHHGVADKANRRKFKRYEMNCLLHFRRPGSQIMSMGIARDLSKGGVRIFVDESVELGEEMSILLRAKGGALPAADIRGTVEVVRVRHEKDDAYDVGCRLINMTVTPLAPAKTPE